jgi:peptidoglycan/LPS O-acetylase OafA/YrhL
VDMTKRVGVKLDFGRNLLRVAGAAVFAVPIMFGQVQVNAARGQTGPQTKASRELYCLQSLAVKNTPSLSSSRFHGLDTLRAVAIVLVVLYHLSIRGLLPAALDPVAAVGWIGVDLFFVLSGFLIGSQLMKPYLAGSTPSLREFYVRRAYRILPAYLVVLALYYVAPVWREAKGPSAAWQYLSFTWNLFLRGYPEQRAFSHVWSLCVEEHFYLLLPVLLLLLMRRPRVWKALAVLAGIVVGGVVLRGVLLDRVVLAASGDDRGILFMKYIYYPTYTRLDGLVAGVGLALLRSFRPAWWQKLTRYGTLYCVVGVALVVAALWLCGFGFPAAELPASVLFAFPLLALGFVLLVGAAVCERSILTVRVPGAASVAALAYSLYLTHKSVAHAMHRLLPALTAHADWKAAGLYAVGCLSFAALLYFGVERPFLRLRDSRRERRSPLDVDREVRLDPAL